MLRSCIALSVFAFSLVLPCFISAASPDSEAGNLQITSYGPKVYTGSPQVWDIVQSKIGLMYFGTTDGVVEFDGSTWRTIPVENLYVRTLTLASDGTIFVGGDGVIGYLKPDAIGRMGFTSLLDMIPSGDRGFGTVQSALATSDGVYFCTRNRLFRFHNQQVNVWSIPGGFRKLLFQSAGLVYVSGRTSGPLVLRGDQLVPSSWASSIKDPINIGFQWNGDTLFCSPKQIYELRGNSLKPFVTGADPFLAEHHISLMSSLPTGELVVGTASGGLAVINNAHEVTRIVNQKSGLPSNYTVQFFRDSQGTAWVATNAGVAHLFPALSHYSEEQGLQGKVYSVGRKDGSLYVGTTAGLYRLQTTENNQPTFKALSSIRSAVTVWTIINSEQGLLVGTEDGIYKVSGDRADQLLPAHQVYDLRVSSRDSNLMYSAGRDGVLVIRQQRGLWQVTSQEKGTGQEFRTVAEDADGKVWATTRADIWRFDFQSSPAKVERFTNRDGVPSGWKNAYQFRKHVVFGTEKGLLEFAEAKHRFVPDLEIGSQFSDGTKPVSIIKEDENRNIWISGKGYQGVLWNLGGGKFDWYEMPFLAANIEETWCLTVDHDETAWASGEEGTLFRLSDRRIPNHTNEKFHVLLRQLSTSESKATLFGGYGPNPEKLNIPYRNNALRFEFAAPFFELANSVQYQFRLDNNEQHWSPWTAESHKDFTNLPPHKFQFRVRARSPHGAISPEAVFAFRVLPPWYRTWWAYCLYFLDAALLSWIIFRWRLQVLRAHNQHLEKVVLQRTLEVRNQRDQNEALLLNILPASIAAELRGSGSVTPTIFEDVTVCFTDFVGFTLASETLSAARLVSALNEYFSAFDAIMLRYGLEKLKTIGDSYMFVSGLPEQKNSHAVDAVLAAFEMLQMAQIVARQAHETDWRMRIGLYSGPVVAGVVGKSKFAFDIWGNTVNLASRMESSGAPDRVNLSASTCSHVHEFVKCESRGKIRTKEGRELEMHFAVGIIEELLQGPLIDGVPAAFRAKYQQTFSRLPAAFPVHLVNATTTLSSDQDSH